MGDNSERLHSLTEDVKLSAHGRHPKAYHFYFFVIYLFFCFCFCFCFPLLLLCFAFQGQVCLSSSLGGNALSQTYSRQFVHLLGKILPCYTHIGDNVYFKFGGMGDILHTLSLVLLFF
jgi:hypothetical protein